MAGVLIADCLNGGVHPKHLCQNCAKTPSILKCLELLFEREQVPQVVDIRHFRMELMERLEPANILRNQQVAGSIPAGGSRTNSN